MDIKAGLSASYGLENDTQDLSDFRNLVIGERNLSGGILYAWNLRRLCLYLNKDRYGQQPNLSKRSRNTLLWDTNDSGGLLHCYARAGCGREIFTSEIGAIFAC